MIPYILLASVCAKRYIVKATKQYEWDINPNTPNKQPSYSIIRHGLMRQGQKIHAAKPGLRTGKMGLTRSYRNGIAPTGYTGKSERQESPDKHHAILCLGGVYFCVLNSRSKPVNTVILMIIGIFDEFWENYPRKENKKKARSLFNKLTKKQKLDAIHDCMDRYEGVSRCFIPFPSTYINNERWEDDPLPKKEKDGKSSYGHQSFKEYKPDY